MSFSAVAGHLFSLKHPHGELVFFFPALRLRSDSSAEAIRPPPGLVRALVHRVTNLPVLCSTSAQLLRSKVLRYFYNYYNLQ